MRSPPASLLTPRNPRESADRPGGAAAGWAFVLAALGYALAAGAGAGLAWDGSWSLFRTLRDGAPFIAHGRWADWWPLWLVGKTAGAWPGITPRALASVYGGLLALIPLGALAICWRALRGPRLEPLRIWPTLGILLAPLPGQWCLMSEATLVAQVGWALLAVLAASGRRPGRAAGVSLALLAAEMFGLHPSSAVLFALAAGWCLLPGQAGWGGAVGFALLAVGRVALSLVEATPYERAEVSAAKIALQWQASVAGLPLAMLAGTFGIGAAVLANALGRLGDGLARATVGVLGAATALAGAAWAAEGWRWGGSLDYRRFVLAAELPLLAGAAWHWRRLAAAASGSPATATAAAAAASRWALPWAAGIFCVTLAMQAVVWRGLLERFETALGGPAGSRALTAGGRRFVTREDLPFLHGTALDHWTACPLSLLLQTPGDAGGSPRGVFVLNPADVRAEGAAVQVTPWDALAL